MCSSQEPPETISKVFYTVLSEHNIYCTDRKVLSLEYQCYSQMALGSICSICRTTCAQYGLTKIAVIHRFGTVSVGETSILVAASAVHRRDAFEGAKATLDTVKELAQIWKRVN